MTSLPDEIPFNRVDLAGRELEYIAQAINNGHLSTDGEFTARCEAMIESLGHGARALLTHSASGALEMSMYLAGVQPGDEVIVPSFTFTSTANCVVSRGAVPVFVDVDPRTLDIAAAIVEPAVTDRTRAIIPVHYAGVGADVESLMDLVAGSDIVVVEDAAQGLMSTRDGRALGSVGHLGALSFHETKNATAGEGGALLINDDRFLARAEVIRTKGTNRHQFLRGQVDKYTWVDVGSSYGISEINAAFLCAQLENVTRLTEARRRIWDGYHEAFEPLEAEGLLTRPCVPDTCAHNAHIYYVLLDTASLRDAVLARMRRANVHTVFHYVPLHDAPAGKQYGRVSGTMTVTDDISSRLVRMPLFSSLEGAQQERVIAEFTEAVTLETERPARSI